MAEEVENQMENKTGLLITIIVIILVILGVGYRMMKSGSLSSSPSMSVVPTFAPTNGPIAALGCEKQYYNPVVGLPKYYLSVEGVDVAPAKTVTCNYSLSVGPKIVASPSVTSPLTDSPQRGGATFRCTTQSLELTPGEPTVVFASLKDDTGKAATCSALYTFPKP